MCHLATKIENQRKRIDLSKTNLPSSRSVVPKPQASTYRRIKDKGRNMEKELSNFLKELPISLSLNPSVMCYKVSLVGLELLLEFYLLSLSSHAFLEDSLLHYGSMFDPSCHAFGVMNNASIEFIVRLGKFVENVSYVSSFLDIFMETHNDFVFLNNLRSYMSGQVEFSCNEQKLSNIIHSLNTLFENTFGFQFYHLHFKDFLLKSLQNQTGVNLELSVNFQGLQVSANMVQAIKDWFTSKNALDERSYHGLTSFHRSFNKELSILASLLMYVPNEKSAFPRQICLPLIEIAFNQAYYSTTLYSFLEDDYGFKLLTSFDLISLSIDHALSDQKKKVRFVKHIQSKDHDAIIVNSIKFRMK
ncbi:hypothetical protein M9H77_34342 [Catharanthus roseus]|uniref:Uncharacterized protein n=1 Tax=Catharanthus roseus TaxID=4058 RepID=A0ACB9ZKX0_CATRO|nr:hypothetical protein M9H77_34342 [Catharanthus roseus]